MRAGRRALRIEQWEEQVLQEVLNGVPVRVAAAKEHIPKSTLGDLNMQKEAWWRSAEPREETRPPC